MKFALTFLLTMLFGLAHTAQAATWGGGTGNWVSDNWGLNAPDGSPGDATYTAEGAMITTGGVININPSDSIAVGNAVVFVNNGIINHSGGTASYGLRLDMRTQYNLSGGTLTDDGSTSWRVNSGGEYNISGGSWSTTSALLYQGSGLLNITGGDVALGAINMDDGTHTGTTVFRITGTSAGTLQALTTRLSPNTGGSSEAQFIFSDSGIDAWTTQGGTGSLTLTTAGGSADLVVDMANYSTAGVQNFTLFDYSTASGALAGTFGSIAVSSNANGAFTLGSDALSLTPGQYFIDYAAGDGSDIVLSANNFVIPEPSTLLLMGMSILAMCAFRGFR